MTLQQQHEIEWQLDRDLTDEEIAAIGEMRDSEIPDIVDLLS